MTSKNTPTKTKSLSKSTKKANPTERIEFSSLTSSPSDITPKPTYTKMAEIQAAPLKNNIEKGLASVFLIIFILLVLVGITWVYGSWRRRAEERQRRIQILKEIEEEAAWHKPGAAMAEILIDYSDPERK
ncbi:hypothetical protein G9A89_002127 [Geosiphon pyriformis]|nr:hypothetical protein G9A89_002127 [Geosiphon pyriformis]